MLSKTGKRKGLEDGGEAEDWAMLSPKILCPFYGIEVEKVPCNIFFSYCSSAIVVLEQGSPARFHILLRQRFVAEGKSGKSRNVISCTSCRTSVHNGRRRRKRRKLRKVRGGI